jgi:hypothetical protein
VVELILGGRKASIATCKGLDELRGNIVANLRWSMVDDSGGVVVGSDLMCLLRITW